ncbi:hypothetical protein METHB2_40047 [Candidatus Methylobacter favarea]|uniref:Uncharacterized protein n=1 Tax=Candidatus Methylobacter favarea TaxID=2707345 RepID=A0A8S0XGV4_9GAMM|nr:hypothetical protein METHB2_40047 [Candidatus Methylobacter favarea]
MIRLSNFQNVKTRVDKLGQGGECREEYRILVYKDSCKRRGGALLGGVMGNADDRSYIK